MRLIWALALMLAAMTPCHALTATTDDMGRVQFVENTQIRTTIAGGTFGPNWEWSSQVDAAGITDLVLSPTRRQLTGTFDVGGAPATCTFVEDVAREAEASIGLRYDFTLNHDAQLNSLWVSFLLPCDLYGGVTVATYGDEGSLLQSAELPTAYTGDAWPVPGHSGVARVEVATGLALGYTIAFAPTAQIMVQDNRAWSGREFEIRIELLGASAGGTIAAGTQFSRPLTVVLPAAVDCQLDPSTAASQTDTTRWVPYTIPWDSAPVDVSWLNEKPAGLHGFLRVSDGGFVFQDGTPARFWGVCTSAGANFPTHEQSEKIAARMAKFGINIVRTHHADAGWSSPNFFDGSYGDTQHFDPEALDRFDYFLYRLKEEGIYVYLDQLVHRKFTGGDGVASADLLDYAAKPYTIFDPTLIALQKQFSHDLWTHVNPYTGLAYKDDPAVALVDFTNENDLVTYDVDVEPYAADLEDMWRGWATAQGVDSDQPVRLVSQRTSDVLRFLDEVQRGYYSEMYQYLRDVGVTAPITGNTWLVAPANLPSQATMDYMDAHAYWDHPWPDYAHFHNRPEVKVDPGAEGNTLAGLAVSRVEGLPFVVSEWGHPWPNEWRGEGPLALAAVGALQGWDGLLGYTYRHSTSLPVDRISGVFDTFNDPAVFGLYPAAAVVFRRGDVTRSERPTVVRWTEADLFAAPQPVLWGSLPAYRSLVEAGAVVTRIATPTGSASAVAPDEYVPTAGPTWTLSDTGELKRDWALGVGTIDTPRSQAVYGFLRAGGRMELADVWVTVENPFGVVALTSLDGREIRSSRHLLLTAVGRVENTGMAYNLTHTSLLDEGVSPVLVEPITGQIAIRSRHGAFAVYAIAPNGMQALHSLVQESRGAVTLQLRSDAETMYYELEAGPTFSDVPSDYWAFEAVEACFADWIVVGFPDGSYQPGMAVTRDQMAVYVARAMVQPSGDAAIPDPVPPPSFSDVPADHWAYEHIEYAVAQNIVQGYDDGTYKPDLVVDRGQMAVYIARALVTPSGDAGIPDPVPPATFSDVADTFWAYRHVEYCVGQGVVKGYDDGTYRPGDPVTRDQMAVYVARAFQLPL